MSGSFLILMAVFVLILFTVRRAIIIVPLGEVWVVQSSGRNLRELSPGLALINPFTERAGPKGELPSGQNQNKNSL